MSTIEFVLPLKINSMFSLNSIYQGVSWFKRQKLAREVHDIVKLTLSLEKIPKKIFENSVQIIFSWNSKLDLDNHGYVTKLIIDGLIGYLLQDDSKKYVQKITHNYWQESGVKVKILEVENGG